MIKVNWDQGFKRIYKKKVKNNEELKKRFWDAMDLFSKEPFNPRLRTHKLTGKLQGLWAFSVAFDCCQRECNNVPEMGMKSVPLW